MNKIDLSWGGGSFDVLLDIRTREVSLYTGGEEFHHRYGGKNYYVSCTGKSGAGWVPARPWLKRVDGYRVDVATRNMFGNMERTTMVAGHKIFVPYDYRGNRTADDYPVVVRSPGWSAPLVMLRRDEVVSHLAGESEGWLADREVRVTFISAPGAEPETRIFKIRVSRGERFPGLRRTVEALHHGELAFQARGEGNYGPAEMPELLAEPFWNRLGLWRVEGKPATDFYKIIGGIARRRYDQAELAKVDGLQAAAPANVMVLSPFLYLQERDEHYDAVGLFEVDGEEVDYEVSLEPAEGVLAMRGDFAAVLQKLEDGAREKHTRDLENRRQQAQWAAERAERDAKFRELCEQHPELEVSANDSVAAGNCRVGTKDFLDRYFGGREVLQVRELISYLANPGVRRVLEHKLLPLAAESTCVPEAQEGDEE